MVLRRPLPELRVEIVCDGKVIQVRDGYGFIIEERVVNAANYVEIAEEVGRVENDLIEIASAMEIR